MTDTPEPLEDDALPEGGVPFYVRGILFGVLVAVAITLGYVFFKTPLGHQMRDRQLVRSWVDDHRMITPVIIVSLYVLFGTCMLPVWWLQIAAGYCFGLWWGMTWCLTGAVITAALSLNLSRWMLGEWIHRRYESRMEKLRHFDQKLGHNGLLVVLAVRMAHVMPFGISNYLFGLTRITTTDVMLGTLFGGFIAIAFYVACGVGGLVNTARFWVILILVNVLVAIPVACWYIHQRRKVARRAAGGFPVDGH